MRNPNQLTNLIKFSASCTSSSTTTCADYASLTHGDCAIVAQFISFKFVDRSITLWQLQGRTLTTACKKTHNYHKDASVSLDSICFHPIFVHLWLKV